MKTLNDLKITNRDYDLEHGFFWVEFENGKSLQCCLKGGQKSIEAGNSGHDDGMSLDRNSWAVEQEIADWEEVELFLIEQARQVGIDIIS